LTVGVTDEKDEASSSLGEIASTWESVTGAGACRKREQRRGDIVSVMANDSFSALAHPLRRGIVERLARGPATIGEATVAFGVSKPTISRHVKVLEEAGVVVRTVEGRTHRLGLDVDALREPVEWIDRQRAHWERVFDAVDEYLEEQERR
jgi:DNA-binding transcriptional ArsR family regulator